MTADAGTADNPTTTANAAALGIAVVGLGEVGRVLVEDLSARGKVRAFDIAFADPASRASRNAADLGLDAAASLADVVAEASLVISAVTAAHTVDAARAVAAVIPAGAYFLDLNSASPEHKRAAAEVIGAAGGRYVEAAVMSPIEPKRLGAPMLLGGAHAAAFAPVGAELGFASLEVYAEEVGKAAATKLCRSVVVKGMETLVLESMLAARRWGVEDRVLDSLGNLFPGADWPTLATYLMSRALQHGGRRSEEMDEAAATVAETGIEPILSEAIARRQAWAGAIGPVPTTATSAAATADHIRAQLAKEA